METEKRGDLAINPSPFCELFLPVILRNYFVQFEDRQEHRDHDSTYDHAKKNNQQRLRSTRSVHRASLRFLRPRNPPFFRAWCRSCQSFAAATIRSNIRRKDRLLRHGNGKVSPFSTSTLTPRILCSTTKLPEEPPTILEHFQNRRRCESAARMCAKSATSKFCQSGPKSVARLPAIA